MKKIVVVLNIVCPIIIGGIIYIFFRPNTHFSIWFRELFDISYYVKVSSSVLNRFIRFYLCDILWAYSFSFTILTIIRLYKLSFVFSLIMCLVFIILIELSQFFGITDGTFDYLDMLFESISSIAAALIIHIVKN